jgi:hypothetical protein
MVYCAFTQAGVALASEPDGLGRLHDIVNRWIAGQSQVTWK